MLTAVQCKMARAALGWGVRDLAARSGVATNTITRFENGRTGTNVSTLNLLKMTFEKAGVRFTDEGGVNPPPPVS
jgi:transcriptional regulator with XRE-family HTH domain